MENAESTEQQQARLTPSDLDELSPYHKRADERA
jgi:hypothetical protein